MFNFVDYLAIRDLSRWRSETLQKIQMRDAELTQVCTCGCGWVPLIFVFSPGIWLIFVSRKDVGPMVV